MQLPEVFRPTRQMIWYIWTICLVDRYLHLFYTTVVASCISLYSCFYSNIFATVIIISVHYNGYLFHLLVSTARPRRLAVHTGRGTPNIFQVTQESSIGTRRGMVLDSFVLDWSLVDFHILVFSLVFSFCWSTSRLVHSLSYDNL